MGSEQRDIIPVHLLPDSERLLRTHGAWVASWDTSDSESEDSSTEALIKEAFNLYSSGLLPIQVKWRLAEDHPLLPARVIARCQRHAEKALAAAESAPAELRRAMVAAQRQRAIQGALAAGDWGPALKALERAGEIAGELREASGLSESDLVLTVAIEEPAPPLPASESEPVSGENGESLTVETPETAERS